MIIDYFREEKGRRRGRRRMIEEEE